MRLDQTDGTEGLGDLGWAVAGVIPVAGDLARGLRGFARTAEAVDGFADVGRATVRRAGGGSGGEWVATFESPGRTIAVTPRGAAYPIPGEWRIMEPTALYPSGYVRYYDFRNQPLDVHGRPGSRAETHIPGDYQGPWPGWPDTTG